MTDGPWWLKNGISTNLHKHTPFWGLLFVHFLNLSMMSAKGLDSYAKRLEPTVDSTCPRNLLPRWPTPVCVKSERPLKQLWVNRWLSVPKRPNEASTCWGREWDTPNSPRVAKASDLLFYYKSEKRRVSPINSANPHQVWTLHALQAAIMSSEPLQGSLEFLELCDTVKPQRVKSPSAGIATYDISNLSNPCHLLPISWQYMAISTK